eukprot:6724793-Alexandrium_andersonii.AAC.1
MIPPMLTSIGTTSHPAQEPPEVASPPRGMWDLGGAEGAASSAHGPTVTPTQTPQGGRSEGSYRPADDGEAPD